MDLWKLLELELEEPLEVIETSPLHCADESSKIQRS